MSNYTTELRYICETLAGLDESVGYGSVAAVIDKARPKVFDFDYPIYDLDYKSVLETKILKHYYTREIGSETYGLWKLRLDTTLNEIMPYYNELYKSADLDYNPLYTVDYREEHTGAGAGSETDSRTGSDNRTVNLSDRRTGTEATQITGTDWNKYSETPQGAITDLDADRYLTNATKDTTNRSDTVTHNTTDAHTGTDSTTRSDSGNKAYNNTDEYLNHVYGHQGGSYAALIKEYRETLLNIDMLIIEELKDLFMLIY